MESLKTLILNNERELLKVFKKEYGLAIQFFMKKIEGLEKDGDIVKFLNNKCILTIKKDQYDLFHKYGYKTAIDIMNEYPVLDLECSKLDELEEDQLVTTMMVSSYANNFNSQKGMYYNQDEDVLILKCQIKNGPYEDRWIERKSKLLYFLQREKEAIFYINRTFSNLPNKICSDIISLQNKTTKVYLFYRYSNRNRYFFGGKYLPLEFAERNRAIILKKI